MNPKHSKLRHQHEHEIQEQTVQSHQQQGTAEFASVEELLRFDAQQVSPPPALAERLQQSISKEAPPTRSWWQRLFGAKP
jgi:hypothetical protein